MAEKKSTSKPNLFDDGKLEKAETPLDFLSRTGVTTQMKEVVKLLMENRPEDPLIFLAEYFDNLADTATALMQAHQKLLLVHHSQPAFYSNLMEAYDTLSHQKGSNGLRGLTGKSYNDLLTLLCRDLTNTEAEPLLKQITCFDHEVIRFLVFRCGVLSVLVYQDFLKQADSLYDELDLYERGKADKQLCEVCLDQLSKAVATTSLSDPISVLHAGTYISAKSFQKSALGVLSKGGQNRKTISKEEFVAAAAKMFLSQVPDFR
ncbi:tubulin polyglutamylase complex subunit 1 [Nematostella vectensis]|uniref:tubulin polyglutamylase complex subunit 1 n=1 Tax=Nematostella vectensis TaxID=45351 RepID=UPI0020776CEA|nr:tubulin polyglutamylase complex subunit 1 [Nematostella vectensis]